MLFFRPGVGSLDELKRTFCTADVEIDSHHHDRTRKHCMTLKAEKKRWKHLYYARSRERWQKF